MRVYAFYEHHYECGNENVEGNIYIIIRGKGERKRERGEEGEKDIEEGKRGMGNGGRKEGKIESGRGEEGMEEIDR